MTPAIVAGIDQTLPSLSNAASNSSPPVGRGTNSAATVVVVPKDSATISVDTVNISDQSRRALPDLKKDESLSEEAKTKKTAKKEAKTSNTDERSDSAMAKVQFVYDLKGELSVRYLDKANNLIYQVPSELMLQMREAASKSEVSVNTKA